MWEGGTEAESSFAWLVADTASGHCRFLPLVRDTQLNVWAVNLAAI